MFFLLKYSFKHLQQPELKMTSTNMPPCENDYDESGSDCSEDSDCSDYSDCSDRSVKITLNITGTTPFKKIEKGEGYSFITQNIANLDIEIKRVNAGKLITWWTYELPPQPNSTYTTKPLYIVKVWLKEWTNLDLYNHIKIKSGDTWNKARIDVSSKSFWKVQLMQDPLPF